MALVAALWGVLVDLEFGVWSILTFLVNLWIAYSLWTGRRWAFTLSFMLGTLCIAFLVLWVAVGILLLERGFSPMWLAGFVFPTLWIYLLWHPATKRYAGLDRTGAAAER